MPMHITIRYNTYMSKAAATSQESHFAIVMIQHHIFCSNFLHQLFLFFLLQCLSSSWSHFPTSFRNHTIPRSRPGTIKQRNAGIAMYFSISSTTSDSSSLSAGGVSGGEISPGETPPPVTVSPDLKVPPEPRESVKMEILMVQSSQRKRMQLNDT